MRLKVFLGVCLVVSLAVLHASTIQTDVVGILAADAEEIRSSGTAYTITTTAAAIDQGTIDPVIVIGAAGTYVIHAHVRLDGNGLTYSGGQNVVVKLRRTNNTAADINQSVSTFVFRPVTTTTGTITFMELPRALYTTTNTNDSITLFAQLSTGTGAGSLTAAEATITAIRIN